jgi:hypothetical protein
MKLPVRGDVMATATLLAALCAPLAAQDRADIDQTQIIGISELPKVLYIVPWKKPEPADWSGRPMASLLDEALAPLDRDVFRRQVKYDAQLRAAAKPSTSAPAKRAR